MKKCLLLIFAVSALSAPAYAQFETSTVLGTVRDASGAVVPDAKVVLTSTATAVCRENDQSGR